MRTIKAALLAVLVSLAPAGGARAGAVGDLIEGFAGWVSNVEAHLASWWDAAWDRYSWDS